MIRKRYAVSTDAEDAEHFRKTEQKVILAGATILSRNEETGVLFADIEPESLEKVKDVPGVISVEEEDRAREHGITDD